MIAIALHSCPTRRRPIPDELTGKARKRARERRRTKERYPANWSKVSLIIRRLSGGRCERCGVYCGMKHLTTHHLGAPLATGEGWRPGNPHDKHDIRRENLQALCLNCHMVADLSSPLQKHRQLNIGTGLVLYYSPEVSMAKSCVGNSFVYTYALIARDLTGRSINGTTSQRDQAGAVESARALLKLLPAAASVDVYPYIVGADYRDIEQAGEPIETVRREAADSIG